MQSVSSNAVAQALAVDTGTLTATDETIDYIKYGKIVQLLGVYNGSIAQGISRRMSITLPSALRPRIAFRALLLNNSNDNPIGQAVIQNNGAIIMWVGSQAPSSNSPCVFSAIFIVD